MMKKILTIVLLMLSLRATSQGRPQNIVIITTDGLRWQEVFKGMDSAIANNSKYNQEDSALIFSKYWASDAVNRRKLLMPFLWNNIAIQGQVFGNRDAGNKMDNANPYWFSYPGYSEIFTGFPDTAINSNDFPVNPHMNVLEYLNKQAAYKGKVAAFAAWDAFDRILNEKRSGFPVICAFDDNSGINQSANAKLINTLKKNSYRAFNDYECMDVFTHYDALDYLKTKKPKVLYIAYGETDEWAHAGHYKDYLNAIRQVDKWISEIWKYLQQDPQYRNNTVLLFTTDHGRGDIKKEEWTSHNNKIADSHQIWLAAMGTGIEAKGENKNSAQYYQEQIAQTIAKLLGYTFKPGHPVAPELKDLFKLNK
jgi:hypothetical protein